MVPKWCIVQMKTVCVILVPADDDICIQRFKNRPQPQKQAVVWSGVSLLVLLLHKTNRLLGIAQTNPFSCELWDSYHCREDPAIVQKLTYCLKYVVDSWGCGVRIPTERCIWRGPSHINLSAFALRACFVRLRLKKRQRNAKDSGQNKFPAAVNTASLPLPDLHSTQGHND